MYCMNVTVFEACMSVFNFKNKTKRVAFLGSWKVSNLGSGSLSLHTNVCSEEPTLRRLKCTEEETGQRRCNVTCSSCSILAFWHYAAILGWLITTAQWKNKLPRRKMLRIKQLMLVIAEMVSFVWMVFWKVLTTSCLYWKFWMYKLYSRQLQ